jgi:hypothetical protein
MGVWPPWQLIGLGDIATGEMALVRTLLARLALKPSLCDN